jgi:hypothetical protein
MCKLLPIRISFPPGLFYPVEAQSNASGASRTPSTPIATPDILPLDLDDELGRMDYGPA